MSYALMPLASVDAPHCRSTRLPTGALAWRFVGALGGMLSGEKSYVCWSNCCPRELIGVTVTCWPFTVTRRKWNTWSIWVGFVADPHLLPPVELHPIP